MSIPPIIIRVSWLFCRCRGVAAIVQAPRPKNVSELQSFLGMLNYYGKFIANLSTLIHPCNHLQKADSPWRWSQECEQLFVKAKKTLSLSEVLVHYILDYPLKLAADASQYGVGAIISHRLPDGREHPIAFASRTLNPSEFNYAQIEKQALALIYGVRKFHQYLYGRRFTLVTDHKPLTVILGPKKSIPPLAAALL